MPLALPVLILLLQGFVSLAAASFRPSSFTLAAASENPADWKVLRLDLSLTNSSDTVPSPDTGVQWGGQREEKGHYVTIAVGDKVFDVTHYGAKGDGKSDCTTGIQKALDEAAKAGGGVVHFPPGHTYMTKPFKFAGSNTLLEVPLGAVVKFFDRSKCDDFSGVSGLISMKSSDYSDIGIVGGGLLDGSGKTVWECRGQSHCTRPHFFKAAGHEKLLIKDITFRNSPGWNLEIRMTTAEVTNVQIFSPPSESSHITVNGTSGPSHNTDGVDIEKDNVYVNNCLIDTGDDNIAIKGGNHIIIEDCQFGHGHGASIGSLENVNMQDIVFRNINMKNTVSGIRIKVKNTEDNKGYLKKVTYENINMQDVGTEIDFTMFYDSSEEVHMDFRVSEITFRNITARGEKSDTGELSTPGHFLCQASCPCKNIVVEDVHLWDTGKDFTCQHVHGTYTEEHPTLQDCFQK